MPYVTADLNALLEHLDLTGVVLAGFSMGAGEVTRYLGTYGSARVRKAAMFGVIPPFLLKTGDNPEGVSVEGGPHNIGWTFPDEVNTALLDFLAK